MPEPVAAGAAGALAKALGPHVARLANEWRKGTEAKRLVGSLKENHPAAPKMLLQPGECPGFCVGIGSRKEIDVDHNLKQDG